VTQALFVSAALPDSISLLVEFEIDIKDRFRLNLEQFSPFESWTADDS
jgi:hypothetical protein